ncbi:hypothetical protein C4573_06680 [Candidatus Woesearchaeota archaeon]|nr:MAG: hypothetical protein C4573_06680 [Candidatus Woesearchaeota archaeon]
MVDSAIRLMKNGFIKKDYKTLYPASFNWSTLSKEQAEKHADEEIDEEVLQSFAGKFINPFDRTGYPKPSRRMRLIMENFNMSVEEPYFWVLDHLRQDQSFRTVHKITDVFSGSESSSFWGQNSQRLGIQQDKVTQYFATVGKMIKDLFQLVRELRIIDERMEIYTMAPKSKSADVTLKGLYIDLVEGSTEKPTSVYGMSRQVGFTILPDLFFNTHIYDLEKLDQVIESMKFNPTVKNVLKRKLFQFVNWKVKTQAELESRRLFNLRYLRQHWGIIKMYMGWIKPYLKNIQRLSTSLKHTESPDIITAFETSVLEIEILAERQAVSGYHPCILATFNYTTKPSMSYQQDYQRGPIHVGRVEINMRAYSWTSEQIDNYKKMKNAEDMELMGIIDGSVHAAMEALGDELNKYLEEAGEKIEKPIPKEEPKKKENMFSGAFEPGVAVFKGFAEMFTALIPISMPKKKGKSPGNPSSAAKEASGAMWQTYKNFKKSHKLLAW